MRCRTAKDLALAKLSNIWPGATTLNVGKTSDFRPPSPHHSIPIDRSSLSSDSSSKLPDGAVKTSVRCHLKCQLSSSVPHLIDTSVQNEPLHHAPSCVSISQTLFCAHSQTLFCAQLFHPSPSFIQGTHLSAWSRVVMVSFLFVKTIDLRTIDLRMFTELDWCDSYYISICWWMRNYLFISVDLCVGSVILFTPALFDNAL